MALADVASATTDLQFTTWGRAASYLSPYADAPVACAVILTVPQIVEDFSGGRVVRGQRIAKVRVSDVAEMHESGVFTFPDGSWRIIASPRRADALGLIWTCEVGPTTGPVP